MNGVRKFAWIGLSLLLTAGLASGCDTPDEVDGCEGCIESESEVPPGEDHVEGLAVETDPEQLAVSDLNEPVEAVEMAIIRGTITASVPPSHGGVGSVYVAVTDTSPFMGDAEQIAGVILADVDFSIDGAAVEYEIEVSPGGTAFVTALLDDNGNAEETDPPGPDLGDLLSLDGLDPPSVAIDQPGDYLLDLELNFSFPF